MSDVGGASNAEGQVHMEFFIMDRANVPGVAAYGHRAGFSHPHAVRFW